MSLKRAFQAFFKALKNPGIPQESAKIEVSEDAHLRVLGMLQSAGRLIDFLKEDISSYSDTQVGTAVRKIHADCAKALEEWVTVRPLLEQEEGEAVAVPEDYDPSRYKLVGKIKGKPPYKGILRHRGWMAHKLSLPKTSAESKREVLCPAEVEIQ